MYTSLVTATVAGALTGDMSASFNSDPIPASRFIAMAVQYVVSGASSPVGTVKVQGSLDVGVDTGIGPAGVSGVTNWSDLDTPAINVTGNTVNGWDVGFTAFRFLRVVWTCTSGSGTMAILANGKANGT